MPALRLLSSFALALALGATAAVAAPGPVSDTGSGVDPGCALPDAAKCVEKGYLETACGRTHAATCTPYVTAAMKAYYEREAAPKLQMLRPNKTDMPANLTDGKYFPYSKRAIKKKGAKVEQAYRKAGDALAGLEGMSMSKEPPVKRTSHIDPDDAVKFHRQPEWASNGRAVRSCKEYAYARSYSLTRFIDAASACKGDAECVFAVAYMNGPHKVARAELLDEDGVPMARQPELPKGRFPKNDLFFPDADKLVRSNGNDPLPADASTSALESALRSGAEYYDIGTCKGAACNDTRKFKNVWTFHQRMHTVNAAMSQAEGEEYERRRAQLRALLEQWGAAVAKEQSRLDQRTVQEIVLPYDMRARDPFERYEIEREYIERGRTERTRLQKKFGPDILEKSLDEAVQQVVGRRSGGGAALGVLAMPAPSGGGQPKAKKAGKAADNPCARSDGWGLEMGFKGPISCRLGMFLRNEWARKQAGHRSCLDLDNTRCDWTMAMFQASALDKLPGVAQQLADEAYCNSYRSPETFLDKDGQVAEVTLVKNRLDTTKSQVEKELKEVSDYLEGHGDKGRRIGKTWRGGDLTGDKDLFAAGYDYDVGWRVEPAKRENDDPGGLVCQLQGSAHANMGFDAWIVGGKVQVVEGTMKLESAPGGNGDARVDAKLLMFDESVFDSGGWKGAQSFSPQPDSGFGVKLPEPKPRFDIYVGVPISGQLWGELLFGSGIEVGGESPTGCDVKDPNFAVRAQFAPVFGAFGLGQVGVGISGVVSAGIRASLTLVMISLPLDISMRGKAGDNPKVEFSSGLSLFLATLSGRISLYVEFLMFDEEFEVFRWKGFATDFPLMPRLTANVSLVGLK